MTHSVKKEKLIVFIKIRKKINGEKRCVWTKVGWRWVWLAGWIAGTSWLSSQLGFDLVRELPQVGYGLVQIGKLSVDSAGVCGSCEGKHHTELLQCRFHGYSFDKMTLMLAPTACYASLYHTIPQGSMLLTVSLTAAPLDIVRHLRHRPVHADTDLCRAVRGRRYLSLRNQ
jgi:hypothetical protein